MTNGRGREAGLEAALHHSTELLRALPGEVCGRYAGALVNQIEENLTALNLAPQPPQEAGMEPTLYVSRCGWCGVVEGTVSPAEICPNASNECRQESPHQFGVFEALAPASSEGVESEETEDIADANDPVLLDALRKGMEYDGPLRELSVDRSEDTEP